MKKVIALLMSVQIALGIFAGCNKKTSEGGTPGTSTVNLTVLTNRTDIVDTYLKDYAKKYKEKTGVNIKWEAITNYYDDVKVRMNSKNYGDVLCIPTGISVSDLPQFFEPLGKNTDAQNKDYAYNTTYAVKNANSNDYTVYGLTYGLSATGIVYNKAAFKKAGIDKLPTTLDDLYAATGKLNAAGIIPLATNFKDKWPLSAWDTVGMTASKAGTLWNDVVKINEPFAAGQPLRTAMDILYKFVNSGWVEKDITTTNWEQSKSDLGQGRVAMMPLGTWAISQIQGKATNKDDIGYMAFPTDNSGKTYSVSSPDLFMGVNKNSKNIKEAKAFLYDFINSDYADTQGFIPSKIGKASSNSVIKEFLSSGVQLITIVTSDTESDKRQKIADNSGVDINGGGDYEQQVALAAKKGQTDYINVLNDLNKKWSDAKKKLGY